MSADEISVSVIGAIGDTPLVALDRLKENLAGRILGNLEYFNPGFSNKDRAAREIITEAEAAGQLLPGQVVVEPEGAEAIADGSTDHPDHPIQGGG